MKELRIKLNNILRIHPETAKDMADIFDHMDRMSVRRSRHANKFYSRTEKGSIREHRENGLSHDLIAGSEMFFEAVKKMGATRHTKYYLVNDFNCHVNETAMRLIVRFLMQAGLVHRSRSRYTISMPGKEWREAAMKEYQELPGDWEHRPMFVGAKS